MFSNNKPFEDYDLEEVSHIAFSAFWQIMDKWEVKSEDQISLMDIKTDLSVDELRRIPCGLISKEMLERISFFLKIYKYLEILFPNQAQAHDWVKKKNDGFGGRSALEFILADKNNGLLLVAKYLNSQFHLPMNTLDKDAQKETY